MATEHGRQIDWGGDILAISRPQPRYIAWGLLYAGSQIFKKHRCFSKMAIFPNDFHYCWCILKLFGIMCRHQVLGWCSRPTLLDQLGIY